ncbi:glutathione S-transferase family protein [Hirschia litorea]|uniref:Glutathione S-transferase family protein n=1 Tax=Hirschia litorea TaxID=1199156 RepID=A0ABW2IPH1_9PROT
MLTLYHCPQTRASGVVGLLKELQALDQVTIKQVCVKQMDGTGAPDPNNPHPEGKVPLLIHDGVEIWETGAIMIYLADLFADAGLNIPQGHRLRGKYLSWIVWYCSVIEPVTVISMAQLSHPLIDSTFRGNAEINTRLVATLSQHAFLLGDTFTAADMLLSGIYGWMGKPGIPEIDAWVDRCQARPGPQYALEYDAKLMANS